MSWKSRILSTSGTANPSSQWCSSSYFLPQTQQSTHDKNNYLFINYFTVCAETQIVAALPKPDG